MAKQPFRLSAIVQALENHHLAEGLFFPEASCFGTDVARLGKRLSRHAEWIIDELPAAALLARRSAGVPEAGSVSVVLDPPRNSPAWREPVTLTFPLIRWAHGEEAHIAYVPALGIEVMVRRADELENAMAIQVRLALARIRAAVSLPSLVRLQRCQQVRVVPLEFMATLLTPKQAATRAEENRPKEKPVLDEVGTDLTTGWLPRANEMDDVIARIAEALTGRSPRSVLVVGPSGAGKTAAVYELVRRRRDLQLGATPFWATSGSRLVAGMSGFGMWQERCTKLWRQAAKAKAILHLGSLVELMEVGKSTCSTLSIAGFLRPYLARGELLAIVECTPEQLPVIEREDPQLLGVFQRIKVDEPDIERGRKILWSFARAAATEPITEEGMDSLDRLHRRYATYSAFPGRPLRFLQNLLQDRPDPNALTPADVTSAFSRETGLPRLLLDDAERLDLEATRQWFAQRVIGQPEAVDLIVDLLAAVKAGLTRPGKPIASLLFIGPTGVGKTEMAKSLAEYLFGDRQRLTRFDMSEYSDPLAVTRLIGGVFGSEGLLTSRLREQPFAVVLLDEFEKAHPMFFDLLLQMLGEGRLTDAGGRLADFRNAVVIMTSNLGGESFLQGGMGLRELTRFLGETGLVEARRQTREHFEHEVRTFLRPELFNRIDRIVPFGPLGEETVLHIARRQIGLLEKRDGILFRGVDLQVHPEVAAYLARKGYDPRYGARPLKRAVERELLAPLAEQMNHYSAETTLSVGVSLENGRLQATVRARLGGDGRPINATLSTSAAGELARRCTDLRREVQALERCPAVRELHNDLFRLEQMEKRLQKKRRAQAHMAADLRQLPELRRQAGTLADLSAQACTLEEEAFFSLLGQRPLQPGRLSAELDALEKRQAELLLWLYCRQFAGASTVTLAVYSEDAGALFDLARAYAAIAERYRVWQLRAVRPDAAQGGDKYVGLVESIFPPHGPVWGEVPATAKPARNLWRRIVHQPAEFLASPRAGVVGLVLELKGKAALPRFQGENGLHVFRSPKQATAQCLVQTSEVKALLYVPPEGVERRGAIGTQERCRVYDSWRETVEDLVLKRTFPLPASLAEVLAEITEARLLANARSLIES